MTKVTVYRYDENNQPVEAVGWFTLETADAMIEADPMTSERHAQAMRRGRPSRGVIETLFYTAEGRWVLKIAWHIGEHGQWVDDEADARPGPVGPIYRFLSDADALAWLTKNNYHDRIQTYLGDLPDEKGPGPGRPEIGGRVQVRLGHLLPEIDAYASKRSCSRAEAVRQLVIAGLDNER
jgi:hypothetical protein